VSRLLMLYPRSAMHGGGEVVGAWMLQALRDEHEVTVLAFEQLHLADLNRACGTTLQAADFTLVTPLLPVRAAGKAVGRLGLDPHRTQLFAWLMRMARRLRPGFDLVISTLGEADLGGPGLQYVHEPWSHRFLDGAPRRPWMRIAGFDSDRLRANATVANSAFTAGEVRRLLGIEAQVLHPPVPGRFAPQPWDDREDGVLVVGRLVTAKRLEEAIEIVARVRAAGRPLTLHLAGRPDPAEMGYLRRVRAALPPWARLHENLERQELLALQGRTRFGLHLFRDEPFGIAVAELAASGCVVLVRRGGGVGEIVGTDELLFDDVGDAADRLLALAGAEDRCARLRADLAQRAEAFSVERFITGMRAQVDRCC
jgi:glycosyltransferase involved in cell wall biosynthesis